MKYTTKTEYGLICLVYMARYGAMQTTTIKEIADAERYSQTYIEKILQSLRQAGIVVARHGNQGGYALARKPQEITIRQVIQALEGDTFEVYCEPQSREQIVCTHFNGCGVKPIWRKTKEVLDDFFDSISLDQVMNPDGRLELKR